MVGKATERRKTMNVSAITGRLTKDPELRSTGSGKSVVSFTLAVVDPDNKDSTDFIDCVAWEGRAEFLSQYFVKGQKVEVTGKIKTRTYEKDGQNRKITELVAKTIGFGESKRESSSANNGGFSTETPAYDASVNDYPDGFQPIDGSDDDLPF